MRASLCRQHSCAHALRDSPARTLIGIPNSLCCPTFCESPRLLVDSPNRDIRISAKSLGVCFIGVKESRLHWAGSPALTRKVCPTLHPLCLLPAAQVCRATGDRAKPKIFDHLYCLHLDLPVRYSSDRRGVRQPRYSTSKVSSPKPG